MMDTMNEDGQTRSREFSSHKCHGSTRNNELEEAVRTLVASKQKNLLDIFQRDPVTVKNWMRCASSAPAGFPSTEWYALIKAETVDLDTIFSSLHRVHSVD